MNPASFIVTFSIIWWLLFFIALPIGVMPDDTPVEGQASSSPKNQRLWIKAGIVTVLSLLLTSLFFYLGHSGVLDIHKIMDE
jgi:predicted secreted protein